MRHTLALTAGICVYCFAGTMWMRAQQARPVTASTVSLPPIEEVLREVRSDLQGERSDILAKNLTLTSDQAARFWPVYASYQQEQNAIMDDQLRGIQRYIESVETLSDQDALDLINTHLDRDERIAALRRKWLPEFQKALGTKMAVRAMQIDRRLSLVHQTQFATKIPLAH